MKRLVIVLFVSLIFFVLPVMAQIDFIPISYGDIVRGEITDEQPSLFYVFEANAGDVISIAMVAEDEDELDTVLIVYSSEGTRLVANNNTANPAWGRLNSFIDRFVIPETDVYAIEATRMEGAGVFMLTLIDGMESIFFETPAGWHFEQLGPNNFLTATDVSLADALNSGETPIPGPGEQLVTVFEYLPEADPKDLEAVMTEFQTEFSADTTYGDTVFGNFGDTQFARVRAVEGTGRRSLIYILALPELPDVVILAMSVVQDLDTGQIVMDRIAETLVVSTGPVDFGGDDPNRLSYGDAVRGTISDDESSVFYTFRGEEGDVVTISMIADDESELDTFLYLYAADGVTELMLNDDALGGGTLNSQITDYTLPSSEVFVIEATRFSGAGQYTLIIEGDSDAESTGLQWNIGDDRSVDSAGLTLALPDGWVSEVDDVLLRIGTSQVALSNLGGFEVLPPGEFNIDLVYVPAQNAESLGLSTTDIESFTESFLVFAGSIGSVEAYSTDQFTGAITFIEANEFDPENLVIIATEVFDDYFIWSVKHGQGSLYSQVEPLVLEIITSVQFQGTTIYP